MKDYLIGGSFAYDTILLHKGQFHTKILPESLARLNVSFFMDSLDDEFGGTAGNIAYNATLFEQKPTLIGSLGKDAKEYKDHLSNHGLNSDTLTYYENEKSPHCWLMTDTINNQIMGFYLGSMKYKPTIPVITPKLWHLCAENAINIAYLVKQAIEQGKDYMFDPGQALPYFTNGETDHIITLQEILDNAVGIFVNEYEAELLVEATGKKLEQLITKEKQFIIRTIGAKGVDLLTSSTIEHIGVAKPAHIVDPTGCGDAFRAGFLYGYTNGQSLKTCTQLGSTMGSFAIEYSGGQNHSPTKEEIFKRMRENFDTVDFQ